MPMENGRTIGAAGFVASARSSVRRSLLTLLVTHYFPQRTQLWVLTLGSRGVINICPEGMNRHLLLDCTLQLLQKSGRSAYMGA